MNPWLFILFFSIFNSASASLPDLKSYIANNQYAKAVNLGEALLQNNANSPSVLFYTAFAYQQTKRNQQAKMLYLKAIENNSQLPEIYNNLASIYVAEKNYDKAAETLTAAINSQKNIATAYSNLRNIYQHLASQAYQKVLDEESRKKHRTAAIKTEVLASLDLEETLKPVIKPKPIIVAETKPINQTEKTDIKITYSPKQTVINWANAWKTKDYKTYINSYSSTYSPKNLSRDKWLTQREQRINRPGDIFVDVSNFDIKLSKNKAYINFDQAYRSATYSDKVRKRMHLTLINDQWRITSEVTLSVL